MQHHREKVSKGFPRQLQGRESSASAHLSDSQALTIRGSLPQSYNGVAANIDPKQVKDNPRFSIVDDQCEEASKAIQGQDPNIFGLPRTHIPQDASGRGILPRNMIPFKTQDTQRQGYDRGLKSNKNAQDLSKGQQDSFNAHYAAKNQAGFGHNHVVKIEQDIKTARPVQPIPKSALRKTIPANAPYPSNDVDRDNINYDPINLTANQVVHRPSSRLGPAATKGDDSRSVRRSTAARLPGHPIPQAKRFKTEDLATENFDIDALDNSAFPGSMSAKTFKSNEQKDSADAENKKGNPGANFKPPKDMSRFKVAPRMANHLSFINNIDIKALQKKAEAEARDLHDRDDWSIVQSLFDDQVKNFREIVSQCTTLQEREFLLANEYLIYTGLEEMVNTKDDVLAHKTQVTAQYKEAGSTLSQQCEMLPKFAHTAQKRRRNDGGTISISRESTAA